MTFNTRHGGEPPWNTEGQIAAIVGAHPDVVMLQEASFRQLSEYVDGINAGLGTTAWHGEFARHCRHALASWCLQFGDESVMVLSHLPFSTVERRLIWAKDDAWVARGVVRAAVQVAPDRVVQVFSCHLPASDNAERSRQAWVRAFTPWAKRFNGARIVAGDFNDGPRSPVIASMREEYVDGWAARGIGAGGTETEDDRHYTRRFDYVFTAGGATVATAAVPPVRLSDHRPLVAIVSLRHTN